MPHVRQQIRDAIKAQLLAHVTLVAPVNVTCNRIEPFQPKDAHSNDVDELPAINIVTQDESTDGRTIGNCSRYKVSQIIDIEIYSDLKDGYENEIDNICVEVQKAMETPYKLGLGLNSVAYNGSKVSREKAERPFVTRSLEYDVMFKLDHNNPEIFT